MNKILKNQEFELVSRLNINVNKELIGILSDGIMRVLKISRNDRRIVNGLLDTALYNFLCSDDQRIGESILSRYFHVRLEEILETFKKEFDLPDITINENYADHAKFSNVIFALKEKFGEYDKYKKNI